MANSKLRRYAKSHGVYQWELGLFFGVCENTITRKLRTELSDEEASKFRYAIDEISRQKTDAE